MSNNFGIIIKGLKTKAQTAAYRGQEGKKLSSQYAIDCTAKFDGNREKDIKDVIRYLELLKKYNKNLYQKIKIDNEELGTTFIQIDENNTKKITIESKGSNKCRVTITDKEVYSEVDALSRRQYATYEKDGETSEVVVSQLVTVINGEECNEFVSIESGEKTDEIIAEVLKNNPEYDREDNKCIYRENISKDEKVKDFVKKYKSAYEIEQEEQKVNEDDESNLVLYESFENHLYHNSDRIDKTYEDYISFAKKCENKCKYIYSVIMDAIRIIEEKRQRETEEWIREKHNLEEAEGILNSGISDKITPSVTSDEEDNQITVDEPNETTNFIFEHGENGLNESKEEDTPPINSEKEEAAKATEMSKEPELTKDDSEEARIDEMPDEELDKFILKLEEENEKKRQEIERLNKIKRARELIELSKKQDKQIVELEQQIHKFQNQIQKKGLDIVDE